MILLEYNEKQGFHHNYAIPCQHRFSSPLFTFGWYPVCVIPDALLHDPDYESLTDRLEACHADYQTVTHEVIYWLMNKMEPQILEY